jgi:hypothetical protein
LFELRCLLSSHVKVRVNYHVTFSNTKEERIRIVIYHIPEYNYKFKNNSLLLNWFILMIPHRKFGVSEPVLVIKMNLLVSENYLSHFLTLIWQSSFCSGTAFIDIGKKLGSWEIKSFKEKGFLQNILVVSWASSKVNYIPQPKIWSPWATGRPLRFFPASMSWFAYKTIMSSWYAVQNKKTKQTWINNSTNHGFQNM